MIFKMVFVNPLNPSESQTFAGEAHDFEDAKKMGEFASLLHAPSCATWVLKSIENTAVPQPDERRLYLVVNRTSELNGDPDSRYRNLSLVGGSYDARGLIAWADEKWGEDSITAGPAITTVEQAVTACAGGGWQVLQVLGPVI